MVEVTRESSTKISKRALEPWNGPMDVAMKEAGSEGYMMAMAHLRHS